MAEHRNIHQQIAEVERELALRASVYPGLIGRGKLRQSEADEHVARLTAVRETLIWCRDHRETIAAVERAAHPVVSVGTETALPQDMAPVILSISVPPGARLSDATRSALLRMAEAAVAGIRALPEGEPK